MAQEYSDEKMMEIYMEQIEKGDKVYARKFIEEHSESDLSDEVWKLLIDKTDGEAFYYIPDPKKTRDLALEACAKDYNNFNFVPKEMLNEEFILTCTSMSKNTIEYEQIPDKSDFMISQLLENGSLLFSQVKEEKHKNVMFLRCALRGAASPDIAMYALDVLPQDKIYDSAIYKTVADMFLSSPEQVKGLLREDSPLRVCQAFEEVKKVVVQELGQKKIKEIMSEIKMDMQNEREEAEKYFQSENIEAINTETREETNEVVQDEHEQDTSNEKEYEVTPKEIAKVSKVKQIGKALINQIGRMFSRDRNRESIGGEGR